MLLNMVLIRVMDEYQMRKLKRPHPRTMERLNGTPDQNCTPDASILRVFLRPPDRQCAPWHPHSHLVMETSGLSPLLEHDGSQVPAPSQRTAQQPRTAQQALQSGGLGGSQDASLWDGLAPEDVATYILSAYHIRIDDAYAAVGMLRGINKQNSGSIGKISGVTEEMYRNDPWSDPAADLTRFVQRGASKGCLPAWWTRADTVQLLTARSLTGSNLRQAEEPYDILRLGGPQLLAVRATPFDPAADQFACVHLKMCTRACAEASSRDRRSV